MSLTWTPGPMIKRLTQGAIKGVDDAAEDLAGEIRDLISIQGVPEARRSLPGEAPRMETKTLRDSISHTVLDRGGLRQAVGSVSPPVEYAYDLEYGITVDQRPFLRTSLARWQDLIREIILLRIEQAMKG